MEHILHSFFGFFIKAEMLLFSLFLLTALLLILRKGQLAMTAFFLGFLFFCATGVSPLGPWALSVLENRFTPPKVLPADLKGMIILGGSFDRSLSLERGTICYTSAGARLLEAYRLVGTHPDLRVVFTGGGVALEGALSESEMARQVAKDLGLDLTQFVFEDKATNTLENATFSFAMIKPQPQDQWLLVTSAVHMPRAVADFRKAGWSVVPYPVDYKSMPLSPRYGSFQIQKNLLSWSLAMREWASLTRDFLTSKSAEFFPSP